MLARTRRLPNTISNVPGSASSASLAPPTHSTIALPLPLHNHQHWALSK